MHVDTFGNVLSIDLATSDRSLQCWGQSLDSQTNMMCKCIHCYSKHLTFTLFIWWTYFIWQTIDMNNMIFMHFYFRDKDCKYILSLLFAGGPCFFLDTDAA